MKVAILVLGLLALATTAMAWSPIMVSAPGPVNLPDVREAIYCQSTSSSWNVGNSSSAFQSEMADDIPNDFVGAQINEVTFYVGQWGASWMDPQNLVIDFWDGVCPPGMTPLATFTIPWGDLTVQTVYNGSWTVKQCTAVLPNYVTLTPDMSLGGFSTTPWGQNPPYCGLTICDQINGCGPGYIAGATWGCPRWSPFSCLFGANYDLAYCIGGAVVPAENTSWGQIRGMYR